MGSSSVLFATTIVALATASSSPSSSSSSGTLRGQRELKAKVVANRIVGGEQSTEGEFPYYVEVGYGCGGALIAPQVMLYAAHCTPSLGAGTSVQVGAYKAQSTQYGVTRKCTKVVDHPNYNKRTMDNDFALCKLNAPVTLDDDRAILVLNEEDSVPATGEDLIVMGVGALKEGGNSPQFLHNVTVPTISNTKCNKGAYYGGEITDNMLCAGFDEGKKDSCQGDSGGPIVRRQWDAANSRFVDSHVGVVSWGYGCAAPKKPGVYARTSKGFGWIKETVCDDFGVSATFCSGGDNNNDNDTDDNLFGDDGFGEDDFFGWPTFAPTSAPFCVDPRVEMRGKKDGCRKWVAKGNNKKIKKKCRKKHNGTKIFKICLETCGMVGLGECSFLQF